MTETAKDRFIEDIKDFVIEIENDNGVNRVIKCANKNGNYNMSFRIITWYNHLCISGDMGDFVFSRTDDMFVFFRKNELKHQGKYWLEKMTACSIYGGGNKGVKFSPEETRKNIIHYINQPDSYEEDTQNSLLDGLNEISLEDGETRAFDDVINLFYRYDDYVCSESIGGLFEHKATYHVEWCMYAIIWAIQQYDEVNKVIRNE